MQSRATLGDEPLVIWPRDCDEARALVSDSGQRVGLGRGRVRVRGRGRDRVRVRVRARGRVRVRARVRVRVGVRVRVRVRVRVSEARLGRLLLRDEARLIDL